MSATAFALDPMQSPARQPAILVVKLGAFGNIVLSMNSFAAIRAHHADARISLLTTAPYADWMRAAPWFDRILIDDRPPWWNPLSVARLRRTLIAPGFSRVYDLQASSRTSWYFRLFSRGERPEWSGTAAGCSHPDRDPNRGRKHETMQQADQLRQAGIDGGPEPDLSWCTGDIGRFDLPPDFAVLVPGSAPHRPLKRWPTARFQALAECLTAMGITPVVVGSRNEAALARQIPAAVDLTGQTSFGDLADLGRAARFTVGNDTGPMHLLAKVGCPSVVLFSNDSDPARCVPNGRDVRVLRRPSLADLEVAAVLAVLPGHETVS